jgi:hypothetical protein
MNQDIIDENDGRLVYTIADARNLVAAAIAAEREACAKLCDEGASFEGELIRARSND